MAFIPPEIGLRVKNRFGYSEIHTLKDVLPPQTGPEHENFLNFEALAA